MAADHQLTTDLNAILAMPAHLSGIEQLETLASLETLSPIFRQACRREVVRALAIRRDHQGGVRQAGMQAIEPYRVRAPRDVLVEAEAAEARRNSPRGRFLSALNSVEQIDPAKGDLLRSLYSRDLADDRQQLNVAAVGTALAMLNDIPGKDARRAIDALADLLLATRKEAA